MLLANSAIWYRRSRRTSVSCPMWVNKSWLASTRAINQWIKPIKRLVGSMKSGACTATEATRRRSLTLRATPESTRPATTTPPCLICVTALLVRIPRRNSKRRHWAEPRWKCSTMHWRQRLSKGTVCQKNRFFRRRAGYWVWEDPRKCRRAFLVGQLIVN